MTIGTCSHCFLDRLIAAYDYFKALHLFPGFHVTKLVFFGYEYLGEGYAEVLGATMKAIVNVVGVTRMTPPIKDLLPRLTPILKNHHEKVQESCIDLLGRIAYLTYFPGAKYKLYLERYQPDFNHIITKEICANSLLTSWRSRV
ncbi:unnamed protein product [Coffea canephora]|uniref:Splicing factor 3B subunit 1 domain-containing protein n=1 Tax=Coffea canephora TaxID=49390 RepID=A0A068TVB2_COFCA|nr:unnamed protein product [Coffea canephora]